MKLKPFVYVNTCWLVIAIADNQYYYYYYQHCLSAYTARCTTIHHLWFMYYTICSKRIANNENMRGCTVYTVYSTRCAGGICCDLCLWLDELRPLCEMAARMLRWARAMPNLLWSCSSTMKRRGSYYIRSTIWWVDALPPSCYIVFVWTATNNLQIIWGHFVCTFSMRYRAHRSKCVRWFAGLACYDSCWQFGAIDWWTCESNTFYSY